MAAMLLRIVAATLACMAAVAADTPCPQVTGEPIEAGSLIRIRQDEARPLTAFVIEIVDYPGSHFQHMEDSLLRPQRQSGAQRQIQVASLMPGTVQDYLKMTAGIYADGATCGAEDKLKVLLDDRRLHLQFTRELIGRIDKAVSAQDSIENLIAQLNTWAATQPRGFRGVVTHVASQLKQRPPQEVLTPLRTVEKTIAESKPSL